MPQGTWQWAFSDTGAANKLPEAKATAKPNLLAELCRYEKDDMDFPFQEIGEGMMFLLGALELTVQIETILIP